MVTNQPASTYKFNNFQEIKSHSSVLYNERMAILFYMLDMEKISLLSSYDIPCMQKCKAIITQIYINIRTLIRNNPVMRCTLGLDTKEEGVYITDIMLNTLNRMVLFCDHDGYTEKKLYIIGEEINKFELTLRDILQYYHYFIRPDFRQKPDIEIATERYKEIADKRTIEELRMIIGKKNKIDFNGLGQRQVELDQDDIIEEEDNDVIGDAKLGMDHVEQEEDTD